MIPSHTAPGPYYREAFVSTGTACMNIINWADHISIFTPNQSLAVAACVMKYSCTTFSPAVHSTVVSTKPARKPLAFRLLPAMDTHLPMTNTMFHGANININDGNFIQHNHPQAVHKCYDADGASSISSSSMNRKTNSGAFIL